MPEYSGGSDKNQPDVSQYLPQSPNRTSISFYEDALNSNTSVTPCLQDKNAPLLQQHSETVLKWENLTYEVETTVDNSTAYRIILNKINGQVRAGESIAIIGSSGAGKTTLLNALSGRIVGGSLSGRILFRGAQRHPGSFKRLTAYVQQDDMMHPLLTVEETLTFASQLRLPNALYSAQNKKDRVASLLRQLRLDGIRRSQIGNSAIRGVSGGERKRVSIGTELLTDPSLLFLDEPTSGLDSNSSLLVVELVKQIVTERNIAALMTIHQPNARIFNVFDKVILLSQGHLVYFGPTSSVISYFSSIGFKCPIHENPADYFVDLMSLDHHDGDTLLESKMRVSSLVCSFAQYKSQSAKLEYNEAAYLPCDQDTSNAEHEARAAAILSRNSWIYEYTVLARRDWLNLMRNVSFLASQGVQSLVTALIVGFMFFYLKHDSVSVQNRLGVLYIVALNATFPTIMPALYAFFDEREIMLRERSSAVYRVTTFYVSKATTLVPIALMTSTIFITGVYFISHLTFATDKFFITLGVLSCLNIVSIAFMLMIGSAVKTMDIAFVIAPAIVMVQLLFGGLLANPTSIVPAIRWIRWINPVYYAFSAFIQNEFSGLELTCDAMSQCYQNGEQVIVLYGMGHFSIAQTIMLLLLIGAVFYVAGYVLLRWKAKPKYIWV
ncbi:hypothetical protein GGI07_004666 [Coemansia sp. Benny D115]|nr:hypothetical protein GGI07_004666 [Coemansia sp. Benny D115]